MAKSKKIAIVVAAIALIAVIGVVGSTLAFFTDQDSKTNTFTMGNVNGTLQEQTADGKAQLVPDTGITFDKVMPGDNLEKKPFMVLGNNSANAYARITMEWDVTGLDDTQAAQVKALEDKLVLGTDWVKGTDGKYYYQKELKAGDKTTNIFDTVQIPTDWTNNMTGISFALKLKGDFIQAENTGIVENNVKSWPTDAIEKYEGKTE